MARQKVEVDVTANTKQFKQGMDEASAAGNVLQNALNKLGAPGQAVANMLSQIGQKSSTGAIEIGVAGAAIGVTVAVAEKAIEQYTSLGEKILKYSQLSGQSAEASSRQVVAFQELGLDADTLAAGMFRLGREVELTPAKLQALGVEIAHTKDGSVDLNGTLLNLIEKWQATGDAAQKDALIFAAFGRAGQAMLPVFEANAATLARLEAQVKSIYTAKDLEDIRSYKIAQEELKQSVDDLGVSLGRTLMPTQKAFVDSLNQQVYVDSQLNQLTIQGNTNAAGSAHARGRVTEALRKQWQASQDAAHAVSQLAASEQDAANAAKADAEEQDKLYTSTHKGIDANFAAQQAELDLKKAEQSVVDTKGKDAEANLRLNEAIVKLANDTVTAAEANAELKGTTLSAQEKTDIFNASLAHSDTQLGANDADARAYIKTLLSIPATVTTSIRLNDLAAANRVASGHGAIATYDTGGTVPGPTGAPQLAVVHGGETVIPAGKGGSEIHIHIHGGLYSDGPGLDRLTMAIANRLSYVTGR